MISLSYDQSDDSKEIFKKSIDLGCQAFIISDQVLGAFLEDFYEVHDESMQVYTRKHVIVYSIVTPEKNSEFCVMIKYSAIDGMNL